MYTYLDCVWVALPLMLLLFHLFGLCMGGLASYVIIVSLFGLFMGGFASYVIIVSDHHNYFYTRKD